MDEFIDFVVPIGLPTPCLSICFGLHEFLVHTHVIDPLILMHKLLKIWLPLNPQIHDPWFRMCTLFNLALNFFDVNMIVVFHPTHSHVPLHIQMVFRSFLLSP